MYRYWNISSVKGKDVDLELTEYQSLVVFPFSYIDIFFRLCIDWLKQLVVSKTNFVKNWCFLANEHSMITIGVEIVIRKQ